MIKLPLEPKLAPYLYVALPPPAPHFAGPFGTLYETTDNDESHSRLGLLLVVMYHLKVFQCVISGYHMHLASAEQDLQQLLVRLTECLFDY